MVEGPGSRFTVDGLEDLRVLMDAILSGISRGGRPEKSLSSAWSRNPPLQSSGMSVTGAVGANAPGAGSIRTPFDPMEIHCLNPLALASARGERTTARRRVDRYFHRSRGDGPPVRVFCIRRTVQDNPPEMRRRVILHVQVERRHGGPEGIPLLGSGTPQPPGKGSHPGKVEA